jgi:DNA ligase-1
MAVVKHRKLYKRDSVGKVRVWWVETDEDQYRVVSGILDGKMVENDWKTAVPKNVGRANATTGSEQALSETESLYEKQLNQGKYHESVDTIDEEGYFEPMLAEKWNDNKDKRVGIKRLEKAFAKGERVFVQPKLDGIRNIAQKSGMTSRDGQPRVSCPHVEEALRSFFSVSYPRIVLDGELYNHEYHDNFNKLQSLILQHKPGPEEIAEAAEKVQYHLYDCFVQEEPGLLFSERNEVLNRHFWTEGPLVVVETHEVRSMEEIDEWYGQFLEQGYEGMIIRVDFPYVNKRVKELIKRKEYEDEEFEIVDIIEGKGNWAGKAKAVKFKGHPGDNRSYDDLPKAGIRGTEAELAELLRTKGKYMGGDVTVRFPNKTPGGDPRFGVGIAFYEGRRKD